ncbi:hypothetical protein KIN20_024483 [Parelaphostrongylus tenuis]|uniref:Uncharacterized protein n=1 Tax=Parelaphostrongylus tenuis TaxID=148309 RepID=A0AAD5QTN9_PARTN|nr:hypothetical protein KIN20_024483 [Parelaphostrongylus tenuis]
MDGLMSHELEIGPPTLCATQSTSNHYVTCALVALLTVEIMSTNYYVIPRLESVEEWSSAPWASLRASQPLGHGSPRVNRLQNTFSTDGAFFMSKITPYRFPTLFTIVDVAQCLYTVQKFCFDFAAVFQFITSDRLLTSSAKAQYWASFMLTWQMMTLSAIATYALRPSRSIFFDKYPIVDSSASVSNQTATNFMMPSIRVEPHQQVVFDAIDCERIGVRRNSNNSKTV